jgi:hypothetical protein
VAIVGATAIASLLAMRRSQMSRFRHGAARIPVLFPSDLQGDSEDEAGSRRPG